ncbi:hypothetical protein [Pseudomonas jessenii]|uniref:hypothetical protein n=1 Tax=Pseudomonas jessenii TaxID=77298 RepID=UPI0038922C95
MAVTWGEPLTLFVRARQAVQAEDFSYDPWANLSEKNSVAGDMQRFHYDSENRLISAQTWQGPL